MKKATKLIFIYASILGIMSLIVQVILSLSSLLVAVGSAVIGANPRSGVANGVGNFISAGLILLFLYILLQFLRFIGPKIFKALRNVKLTTKNALQKVVGAGNRKMFNSVGNAVGIPYMKYRMWSFFRSFGPNRQGALPFRFPTGGRYGRSAAKNKHRVKAKENQALLDRKNKGTKKNQQLEPSSRKFRDQRANSNTSHSLPISAGQSGFLEDDKLRGKKGYSKNRKFAEFINDRRDKGDSFDDALRKASEKFGLPVDDILSSVEPVPRRSSQELKNRSTVDSGFGAGTGALGALSATKSKYDPEKAKRAAEEFGQLDTKHGALEGPIADEDARAQDISSGLLADIPELTSGGKLSDADERLQRALHASFTGDELRDMSYVGSHSVKSLKAHAETKDKENTIASRVPEAIVDPKVADQALNDREKKSKSVVDSQPGLPHGEGSSLRDKKASLVFDEDGRPLPTYAGNDLDHMATLLGTGTATGGMLPSFEATDENLSAEDILASQDFADGESQFVSGMTEGNRTVISPGGKASEKRGVQSVFDDGSEGISDSVSDSVRSSSGEDHPVRNVSLAGDMQNSGDSDVSQDASLGGMLQDAGISADSVSESGDVQPVRATVNDSGQVSAHSQDASGGVSRPVSSGDSSESFNNDADQRLDNILQGSSSGLSNDQFQSMMPQGNISEPQNSEPRDIEDSAAPRFVSDSGGNRSYFAGSQNSEPQNIQQPVNSGSQNSESQNSEPQIIQSQNVSESGTEYIQSQSEPHSDGSQSMTNQQNVEPQNNEPQGMVQNTGDNSQSMVSEPVSKDSSNTAQTVGLDASTLYSIREGIRRDRESDRRRGDFEDRQNRKSADSGGDFITGFVDRAMSGLTDHQRYQEDSPSTFNYSTTNNEYHTHGDGSRSESHSSSDSSEVKGSSRDEGFINDANRAKLEAQRRAYEEEMEKERRAYEEKQRKEREEKDKKNRGDN